jgi:hypothetical protein
LRWRNFAIICGYNDLPCVRQSLANHPAPGDAESGAGACL